MKKIMASSTVKSFVEKMQKGLSKGRLANLVFFEEEGELLIVRFEKLGTSKILFSIQETESGFIANFLKENIAFTHGMFRKEVEKKLIDMMIQYGATIE